MHSSQNQSNHRDQHEGELASKFESRRTCAHGHRLGIDPASFQDTYRKGIIPKAKQLLLIIDEQGGISLSRRYGKNNGLCQTLESPKPLAKLGYFFLMRRHNGKIA